MLHRASASLTHYIQKRQNKLPTKIPPIRVMDLVAYQINDRDRDSAPPGEFQASRVTSPTFNPDKAQQETEAEVVARIAAYIGLLAECAARIHIKQHFTPTMPPEIRDKYANHITRLSLHEFALYPLKARGPLTVKGFTLLMDAIEAIAVKSPINLYLILGTVPVCIEKVVQNIGIMVQCGERPILHPFAKVLSSPKDPLYKNTINATFASNLPTQRFITYLPKKGNKLARKLFAGGLTLKPKSIQTFINFCHENKQYQPPVQLLNFLNVIKKNVESNVYVDNQNEAVQHASVLLDEIKLFEDSCENSVYEAIQKTPNALLGGEMVGLFQGGNVIFHTAGNQPFSLVSEICVDHFYGLIRERTTQIDKLTWENEEKPLPVTHSHIVISKTIKVISENLTSSSYVQADPKHIDEAVSYQGVHLNPLLTLDMQSPAFGSHTRIDQYSPKKLSMYSSSMKVGIEEYYAFIETLRAYQHAKAQNLGTIQNVDVLIRTHILMYVVNFLEKDPQADSSLTDSLKQCGYDSTTAMAIITKSRVQLEQHRIEGNLLQEQIIEVFTIALSLLKRLPSVSPEFEEKISPVEKIKSALWECYEKKMNANSPRLWKPKLTKNSAIAKMVDVLDGLPVRFSRQELHELEIGKLGNIIQQAETLGVLPQKFLATEATFLEEPTDSHSVSFPALRPIASIRFSLGD